MTNTTATPILTAVNNAMELAIRQIVRDEMAVLLQDLRHTVKTVVNDTVEEHVTALVAKGVSMDDVDERIEEQLNARLRDEEFMTESDVENLLDRRERDNDTDDVDRIDEDRVNELIELAISEMRDADDSDGVMTDERVEELIVNAMEDHKSETQHLSEGDIDGRIEELLGQHDFEDAVRDALRNLVRSM